MCVGFLCAVLFFFAKFIYFIALLFEANSKKEKIAIASASCLNDMKEDRHGTKPSDVKEEK